MHAVQDSKLLSVLSCQYNIPVDFIGLNFWFNVSSSSSKFSYPPIAIDNIVVLQVTEQPKYLGLTFESWTHHIAEGVMYS